MSLSLKGFERAYPYVPIVFWSMARVVEVDGEKMLYTAIGKCDIWVTYTGAVLLSENCGPKTMSLLQYAQEYAERLNEEKVPTSLPDSLH